METNLLWSKKRDVTQGGVQLTSFVPKNVTSLTGGSNWPFRCLDFGGNDDDDVQNIYLRKKYLGIRSVGILGVCHIDGDNYEEYDLKLWDIWCLWCLWWWGRTRDNDEKHMISIWSIYGDSDNDDDEEHMISIWNIKFDRRFSPSSLPFQLKCQRQRVGQTPFSIFNSLSFYSIISTAGALIVKTV